MAEQRLVFIGGLHRSGTTLIARCLAEHPLISGFENTGVPADEGQHLQTLYPPAKAHGGPGRFAFDRRSHLTEESPLVSEESRRQLLSEWSRWWDSTKPIVVEKSPPNLLRGRFLQALFPDAALVMVLRHPLAVAYATQKWSETSLRSLVHHWVVAHEGFAADSSRLENLLVVRFEELIADPDGTLERVYRLLAVDPVPAALPIRADANVSYFERWTGERRLRRALLVRLYEERVSAFGYSLRDPERVGTATHRGAKPLHV
jgi:Sulfotransferase family